MSKRPATPPGLLTLNEAAKFLRITRQTFSRFVRGNRIAPAQVQRGRKLYSPEALVQFRGWENIHLAPDAAVTMYTCRRCGDTCSILRDPSTELRPDAPRGWFRDGHSIYCGGCWEFVPKRRRPNRNSTTIRLERCRPDRELAAAGLIREATP